MPDEITALRSRYGVLQMRQLTAGPHHSKPIVCLHPAPFDGSYFTDFAASFDTKRTVWAPDYPGYGGSTAPPRQPTIDDYAAVLLDALRDLEIPAAHLLGFHTGCLVACEMARQLPESIADLVLIDAPYFNGATQRQKYAESVSEQRNSWGFGAAFSYPCAERLAQVDNRALLIATGSNLAAPTREAAAILTNAELENCQEITRPALINGRERFAALISAFLQS